MLFLLFALAAHAEVPCATPNPNVVPIASALEIKNCAWLEHFEVIGHRGAGASPENTRAAFDQAVAQGGNAVELDLQITRDGQIVVTHDIFLRFDQCRYPDGTRLPERPPSLFYVHQHTLAEVQAMDCGTRTPGGLQQSKPGEKIMTLPAVLDWLKAHPQMRMVIEIKYDTNHPEMYPPLPEYVSQIAQTVNQAVKKGLNPKQFLFHSFSAESLALLKKEKPEWEVSPLLGTTEGYDKIPQALGAGAVSISYVPYTDSHGVAQPGLTPAIVQKLHAQHIKVYPWTVDDAASMKKLVAMGVDGIITNRIDVFQDVKKELCSK